ncbi:MAG: aminotransferase class I/II-fold pyridoxal phosphate-dependent enzyme, partial [Solirubrobacteraceae bacterium]
PYERLSGLKELAEAVPGGMVDCSIGTPCDPPPSVALRALVEPGAARGYPPSAGTSAFRAAAAAYLARTFGVDLLPTAVAACVGTKEMVASTPRYLRLRDPSRDTVLYPSVSYPTYAMGAQLADCRAVPVPPADADGAGVDLDAVAPADVRRALLLWVNSPANPSGGLSDLVVAASWGRRHGVPVFSDECYAEYTWESPPRTILQCGTDGVVAVHSVSKRSNLAGVRAGFFGGDAELVGYLRDVRQHAGMMVPGPVQATAVAAWSDDAHVIVQRARYRERLELLAAALSGVGCPTSMPAGGFYLWSAVPPRWHDAWAMTEDLAKVSGMLVSPGDLYGPDGAGHVRIAVVQPTERLALVAERLAASGWS